MNMDSSWIKLHRKLKRWEWYHRSEMVHLFVHLLLSVNHHPGKSQGVNILPGQTIIGRKQLSEDTGLSEQTIRTCLDRLERTNEISRKSTKLLTSKSTKQGTLLTLVNWRYYRDDEKKSTNESTKLLTSDQPATNQRLTTNKNEKKDKNEKNNTTDEVPLEHSPIKKEVYEKEHRAYRFSVALFAHIRKCNPKAKEPDFQSWAIEADRMHRIDKRSWGDIGKILTALQKEEPMPGKHLGFWQSNILSAGKFRKQFDDVWMRLIAANENNSASTLTEEQQEAHREMLKRVEKQESSKVEAKVESEPVDPELVKNAIEMVKKSKSMPLETKNNDNPV